MNITSDFIQNVHMFRYTTYNLELQMIAVQNGCGDAGRGRGPRRGVLERGEDYPAGSRGVRMGRTVYVGRVLGFFESFPFFQIGRRL